MTKREQNQATMTEAYARQLAAAVATAAERKQGRTIARLTYLGNVLVKYALRWNDNPSARMLAWVDEYNGLRSSEPAAFRAYCDRYGFSRDHNAYDCLA